MKSPYKIIKKISKPSTRKQGEVTRQAVYDFIVKYKIANNGIAPSFQEIMAACEITTTSIVHHHLLKLERAGKIFFIGDGIAARSIGLPGYEFKAVAT